jgi:hypothetical protein
MAETAAGVKRFYTILALLALIGLGVLAYLISRPTTTSIPARTA